MQILSRWKRNKLKGATWVSTSNPCRFFAKKVVLYSRKYFSTTSKTTTIL